MWLLFAFIAVPMIEIALFIQVGGIIGLGWTLTIVLFTAVLGTWLVRTQGAMALGQLGASFSEMRDPTEPLVNGAMILFAGALLLTPGFFTDAIGFALLVPAFRKAAFHMIRARVKVQGFSTAQTSRVHPSRQRESRRGDVIDGEFTEITETDPENPGASGWTKH